MTKLTFIADTHYYSKTLGTSGRQYNLRSGSDQKCLGESREIIQAAFKKIADSDTQAVMIAGDVSNDGEMVSHQEFRQLCYELKESKPVYIITATHDWCNDGNPRRFSGNIVTHDVPVIKAEELPEFYQDFGPKDALSVFTTHIGTCSYVVQLSDNVRLLALNDDKNENMHAGFTEEHFKWIEEQIARAKKDNCLIIGMEHHLLVPHIHPFITGGACVANREYITSRLADAGLKYMFCGHSHMQNTDEFISEKGNKLIEVNVGSLVGYPSPIVNVTVNDDMTLSYEVDTIDEFEVNNEIVNANEYLKNHCTAIIHRLFDCPNKDEFADRMTAMQMNGEALKKYYPIAHPILEFVKNKTVGGAYKSLRKFGISRFVDKDLVEQFKDDKILSFVDQILLSAMDGSVKKFSPNDSYYRLVMSVVSIPSKIAKNNADLKKLIEAVSAILTGGKYNNQRDTI